MAFSCSVCGSSNPSAPQSDVCIVHAFEKLREAAGGAFDGVDAMAFVCNSRHDDGCACSGVPNDSPEFSVRVKA